MGLRYANTQTTLAEYIANWLISTKSSRRPSTWRIYEFSTRLYILPNLGNIKLKDLRPDQIQWMYNRMLEQNVGIPTVLKVHGVLHSALAQAEKMGMISHNPVSATQPPKGPAREMAILNESQVSQLLIALHGHRLEAVIHLAIVTGMRQMELLGLKWTDLDWIRKTIKVERQLDRPDGEGVKFSAPKTRYGKRSVALGRKIDRRSKKPLRAPTGGQAASRRKLERTRSDLSKPRWRPNGSSQPAQGFQDCASECRLAGDPLS